MHRPLLFAACAALLAMGVYLGTLDASFVYDDGVYIENNPQLQSPGNLFVTPFPEYMGTARGLYRPVTTASLALDYWFFGLEPWGFHLTNLLLHGFCTLVCFYVLRRLMAGHWGPFAGALLFGLHPVHTEAVAWAVGRSELLAGLGCMLSLLFYLWGRGAMDPACTGPSDSSADSGEAIPQNRPLPGAVAFALSLAAFAFAALSKESALSFPGIIVAGEVLLFRKGGWRLKVLKILPFVVVLVLVVAARFAVLGTLSPEEGERVLPHVAYPERIELAGWVLSNYVRLTAYPFELSAHYRPLAFFEAGALECYLPAVLFLAAAAAACFCARRFAFAAALFFMPLVPVLNLVPIGEVLAERFLYFPLAGAAAALGLVFARWPGSKTAWGALAILCLGAGFLTVRQAEVWTDSYTLWESAVRADPADPQAHFGLGIAMMDRGMLQGEPSALAQFNKVRKLNPNYKEDQVHLYFGKLYRELGRPADALREYEQALLRFPFHVPSLKGILNMERELLAAGKEGELTKHQRKGLALQLLKAVPDQERKEELRRTYQDFLE